MLKLIRSLFIALVVFFSASSAADSLKVYAASSMTNAIQDISKRFYDQTGIKVVTVFGGSASLARQIDKGAPADIYISANKKWMEYLIQKGTITSENATDIARNRLVVVAGANLSDEPFDSSNKQSWVSLTQNSRIAVGQTDSVPAGIYAKQSLQTLGVWEVLKSRLASANNVRFALALVERGETDIGIVYRTDALYSDAVTIITELPESSHDPIVYPAALVNESEDAQMFFKFLMRNDAKQVLNKYGFQTINSN
ncbi:molybdate ABC transporter substrate-binding protein [Vibrio hannami]|uniref:molybdate ABC transporter substrate-binding protein n=1 Tax=Vibrio hannami TaxID=2717094 RepID=UPI002410AC8C|nr:molybdate ABC transporter substrate-binding protein [Vibrio hannami]MDG3085492.1 molybdate ABC transporter substrate-binding protein [Vibrio hannami]